MKSAAKTVQTEPVTEAQVTSLFETQDDQLLMRMPDPEVKAGALTPGRGYTALAWRNPGILFLPLGFMAAIAPLPIWAWFTGKLGTDLTALASLAGVIGFPVIAVLLISLGLMRGKEKTMAIFLGTVVTVAIALSILVGIAAAFLMPDASVLKALMPAAQAEAMKPLLDNRIALSVMAYLASMFGLTVHAFISALILRYVGMQIVRDDQPFDDID